MQSYVRYMYFTTDSPIMNSGDLYKLELDKHIKILSRTYLRRTRRRHVIHQTPCSVTLTGARTGSSPVITMVTHIFYFHTNQAHVP